MERDPQSIEQMLEAVLKGVLRKEDFVEALVRQTPTIQADQGGYTLDLERGGRCGYPEVVYGENKSTSVLAGICDRLLASGQPVFVTRVTPEKADTLKSRFPQSHYNPAARTFRVDLPAEGDQNVSKIGSVAILTAGTTDFPVAEEARETLDWMRVNVVLLQDIGVAGPQRLLERLPQIRGHDAVIVAAGMEGALPSVVGGWVDCPVIGVPTSVGYGVSFGGITALLGMLNSCAANVTVVNIDAGFKAGYLAGLIARRAHRQEAR